MEKELWQFELWYNSFSVFIQKINNEFKHPKIECVDFNMLQGKFEPNKKIYLYYNVNNEQQNFLQRTLTTDSSGFFKDRIPSELVSELDLKHITYSRWTNMRNIYSLKCKLHLETDTSIAIEEILNDYINNAVDIVKNFDNEDIKAHFDNFLNRIKDFSDVAIEYADTAFKEILKDMELKQAILKEDLRNANSIIQSQEFLKLKESISNIHPLLDCEKYDDFYDANFFTKYIIYKVKQDEYQSKKPSMNKTKYFTHLVTEGLIKERRSNSQYFEIANAIKPSKHKEKTINQSDELNTFNQSAIGISLYLYDKNDKYFKFMQSIFDKKKKLKKIITVDDVISSKNLINEFMEKQGLLKSNELYYETTLEDTFHFTHFTAISKLMNTIIDVTSDITQKSANNDILVGLYILESLTKEIPNIINEYDKKYNKFVSLVDSFSRNTEMKNEIDSVIKKQPNLVSKIENDLMALLKSYDITNFYKIYGSDDKFNSTLLINMMNQFYETRFNEFENIMMT